ncbi:MAG: aminotransferase class V-fold PLP-dependent enzyme [Clostridia bacterium]|nr:aminotransferase class V-fold PLP-dependent enzyme [Clostridia bacterium]
MIYFDNAATGGFKPAQAIESAVYAMKNLNANAGRSGHKLSLLAAKKIFEARKAVSALFNNGSPERIVFTSNCTSALNAAIFGLIGEGEKVVTTVTEHNSVLRPLYELKRRGRISLEIISPAASAVTVDDIEKALSGEVGTVVMNAASNVTGTENDIEGIGKLLKEKNIRYIVDGAQAAGHKQIDMKKLGIDALCAAGHKGLMATQGVGVLAFNAKTKIYPTVFGGTGTETFNEGMPDNYPERLEAGTMNTPAILSLGESSLYLKENLAYISAQLLNMSEFLINRLSEKPYLKVYSIPNRCGIVAFSHNEIPSQGLAEILSEKYDIAVRGGFHCAPLMHKFLGTEKWGLVRVSLAPQNTRKEISALISALDEISFAE